MSRFDKGFIKVQRMRAFSYAQSRLDKGEMIGMAATGYNYRHNAACYFKALNNLMRTASYRTMSDIDLMKYVLLAVDNIPQHNCGDSAYVGLFGRVSSIIPGFVWSDGIFNKHARPLREQFDQWERVNKLLAGKPVIFMQAKKLPRSWGKPSLKREVTALLQKAEAVVAKVQTEDSCQDLNRELKAWLIDYLNEGGARGSKCLIALDLLDVMAQGQVIDYGLFYRRACEDQCRKTKIEVGGQAYWLRQPDGRLGDFIKAFCLLNDKTYRSADENSYEIISPQKGVEKDKWFKMSDKSKFSPTCCGTSLQYAGATLMTASAKPPVEAIEGATVVEMQELQHRMIGS